MICKTLKDIRIKTHDGIKEISRGYQFNTSDLTTALHLLNQKKIVILSPDKNISSTEQCLLRPPCPPINENQEVTCADILTAKSAMSAGDQHGTVTCKMPDAIPAWPPEDQMIIDWFKAAPRIEDPFDLTPHIHISDPEKFYAALERDVAAGPTGPRARYGVLMAYLRKLQMISGRVLGKVTLD